MYDLTVQQSRQLIDCEQLYATYRDVNRELATRFAGAMHWKTVKGNAYLYRKTAGAWRSLGPRSEATILAHDRFHEGRAALRDRRDALDRRLRAMAPVNRAMRLGRVPATSARLIRRLEREGVLGSGLRIVGTHALYAYERLGGVHFGAEAVATADVDLLYDTRASLKLLSADLAAGGLIGILRALDRSFRPTAPGSFRAVNDAGFMVDLIAPTRRPPSAKPADARIGGDDDDLVAVAIEGLAWLENVPAAEHIVLDEQGFPLTMVVPDLRAFLCHKLWVAGRDDRDPLKKRRDRLQAETLAAMLATRLPAMRLDAAELDAVPAAVRALGAELIDRLHAQDDPTRDEGWDG